MKQDYYSDNEEMLAKLEAGAVGYDVLVPTGNTVETLIRENALKPLDASKLPHLKNIKPEFLDPWYDRNNRFSVPYAYSISLIGYNADKLRELDLPTDSWALIFEPRYLERLRNKVTVLNSQKELMAAAMRYLGYSIQDRDMDKWDRAKRLILRAKPYWAAFSNSTYIKDLAIGNMVLHKGGRNTALAHQFMDFMLEGENSASLSNLIGAGNPNAEATRLISPEISGNVDIFPDAARFGRLEMIRDFDARERRILSRMWTQIKVK